MFRQTDDEIFFIALLPGGFLYGIYTGIFSIYLQYHSSKPDTNKAQKILFYSTCALYVSSISVFVCDTAICICHFHTKPSLSIFLIMENILFAWCDFIAQSILIYRCWIVWGRNIRIVIIPSIFTCAFLVIWIVSSRSVFATSGWPYLMGLAGLSLSLTVNALVTGLIVFRIFKVFWEVKDILDDEILGTTVGRKLRRTMLVLIESDMPLFLIQLARLVVYILRADAAFRVYNIIVTTHHLLNGITPTIILVRTSMGLSFHDEKSMEEVAIGSSRSVSNHPNSSPEMGSIGIIGRDIRDGDDIDVQRSNDIDVVER